MSKGKTCGDCRYLDTSDPNTRFFSETQYPCTCPAKIKKEYHTLNDPECGRDFEDKNPGPRYQFDNKNFTPTGCLTTFIICQILKLEDDNPFLNTLRAFRERFSKKLKYYGLLYKYDILSPQITPNLKNNENLCKKILEDYIYPLCNLAGQALLGKNTDNNIDSFVELFNNMLETLRNQFNIQECVTIPMFFSKAPLGKGRPRSRHG